MQIVTVDHQETMADHQPNKDSRNTNALAMVAGALLALIAVLAFLALISHRGGAQEQRSANAASAPSYEMVSVWAVAS